MMAKELKAPSSPPPPCIIPIPKLGLQGSPDYKDTLVLGRGWGPAMRIVDMWRHGYVQTSETGD